MANEYIDRILREQNPPVTPEDFRMAMDDMVIRLTPKFIEKALVISDAGETKLSGAIDEFSDRSRVMETSLQPRIAAHNVDRLIRYCLADVSRTERQLVEYEFNDLSALQALIVHTPDGVREVMEKRRLITHSGERMLRRLDRESRYYHMPNINPQKEVLNDA